MLTPVVVLDVVPAEVGYGGYSGLAGVGCWGYGQFWTEFCVGYGGVYGEKLVVLAELVGYDEGVGNWLLYNGYGVFEFPWYTVGAFEVADGGVGIEGYGSITFELVPPYAILYTYKFVNRRNKINQ